MLNLYLVSESLPNAAAELVYYADREFYKDWWNATSFNDLAKKQLKLPWQFFDRHI